MTYGKGQDCFTLLTKPSSQTKNPKQLISYFYYSVPHYKFLQKTVK